MNPADLLASVRAIPADTLRARVASVERDYPGLDTRDAILEVATALLVERGFDPDCDSADSFLPFDAADIIADILS